MPNSAYIALGSNLGDPEKNLRLAAAELQQLSTTPLVASSVWWSGPEGFDVEVDEFCNAVVRVSVDMPAEALLQAIQSIERGLGRKRGRKKGDEGAGYQSRTIDLDIISYGNLVLNTSELEIPHPRASNRRFVLLPLQEICPEYRFPGLDRGLASLIEAAPDNLMRRASLLTPWV